MIYMFNKFIKIRIFMSAEAPQISAGPNKDIIKAENARRAGKAGRKAGTK